MRLGNFVEHVARDLACSERKPRNECDSVFFTIVDNVVPFAIGKTVSVLNRGDGNDLSRTLDMLPGNIRQSHQANLALVLQFSQSLNRSVKRYDRIRGMQLINVDSI